MENNAENIEICQEISEHWNDNLTELESELIAKASSIMKKLEAKSLVLKEKEQALIAKENELKIQQTAINDCTEKMKSLEDAEKKLQIKSEALAKREADLNEVFKQLDEDYKNRLAELEQNFSEKNVHLATRQNELDQEKCNLADREAEIIRKEMSVDTDCSNRRQQAEQELLKQQQEEVEKLQKWLADEREKHRLAIIAQYEDDEKKRAEERDKALAAIKKIADEEREKRIQELEEELKEKEQLVEQRLAEKEENFTAKLKELEAKEQELDQREQKCEEKDRNFRREQRRLKNREEAIEEREGNLEEEIQKKYEEKISEYENKISAKDTAYKQIRDNLVNIQQENTMLQVIKDSFGDTPYDVMNERINNLLNENEKLKNEIHKLPPESAKAELESVKHELEGFKDKCDVLSRENSTLKDSDAKVSSLESERDRAMIKLQDLEYTVTELTNENEKLHNRINRLCSDESRAIDRDERIKSIKEKLEDVNAPETAQYEDYANKVDEIEWLEAIGRNCYDYGFKFSKRILYAFHTALKIADWSTITVLAGVSGTGKSELPHLYAKFGGLNFMPVSVQPNWDSQESMLGFFNSIDNKFDAQPLLRFLSQCSDVEDNMDKSLNIVLLDEMNLAHVEHYFAEFLSKLELRRDKGKGNEPFIDINIGAGMKAYPLKLTRNILWTGTMNQDETTKSLSDKVLDRGLVINFPRPKKLISRKKLQKLEDFAKARSVKMLDYRVWDEQWVKTELNFSPEQQSVIEKYRDMITDINNYLSVAGRALGHRVWQSIEFYIVNYPEVIAAMEVAEGQLTDQFTSAVKIAVEDQLVQKVMPKLRGIETRGDTDTECLQKIQSLLANEGFSLNEDFDRARALGYGQFMWNSAEYLANDIIAGSPDNDTEEKIGE